MKKIKLMQQLVGEGVVAVLRGDTPDEVVEMAEQAIEGGIKVIEVTMTVPFALQAIEKLAKKYSSTAQDPSKYAIIGVGTVLDPETARVAILSGSEFVVGPSLNPDTVTLCNRYRVPVLPGVMTIQEIQRALELGVDVVKLFPGNLYSPSMIKAIKGPLPQANVMPTGGVSLSNLGEWIKAGAVAVGIGSDLTTDAVKAGDYSLVAKKAAQYIEAYRAAKG
ncbi:MULTISPECIES: bifunctional 2-keto-4-hydroxyglutarate aldolase/2-keto-3-deoxy-6-phosphogluconate aldolase [unclassified Paenibacillus]|uniref:bifunctional 2-keto-4-hydroxyglutarate aldolase/2-keto-3-deoxy-6-phosphogluconate aldolase n=1 Tax=unclassified Paenibacillus TaxID=185978 RepID=UPI001AE186F1|nr:MULTISPECIES: bifunctional 2-keto-4-hydroxyglutarate aldolase/2-keto-3-deoxy-6-phosphogluconate aldolase [unclassified Paenibacillus]MBP1157511.1 2-dehydro-3-deoxyphosphogluconate aldolase/(4S)-4-hydroxy-2-oxoglutarate aldolase [Paenibacillus sp. PvP091]MBP1171752.1 2-dehydro-3-deoxyphosphogluconate aldolase/(4S)-4-hydroxy-2-oxoglutarate aldolase [Paenibacillus sp. PvR098]MBP2438133.1 2-dehydro-3-deoxyphosphogluconate aldolase/(4S)-4-hydroxy-2-oxoglutarate aldolase [Paenibacillus sp. PvP052]